MHWGLVSQDEALYALYTTWYLDSELQWRLILRQVSPFKQNGTFFKFWSHQKLQTLEVDQPFDHFQIVNRHHSEHFHFEKRLPVLESLFGIICWHIIFLGKKSPVWERFTCFGKYWLLISAPYYKSINS